LPKNRTRQEGPSIVAGCRANERSSEYGKNTNNVSSSVGGAMQLRSSTHAPILPSTQPGLE
jgi:hypothetical protein